MASEPSRTVPPRQKKSGEDASQIDENLRRVFAEDIDQEVPSHLMDLLTQLKDQDKK